MSNANELGYRCDKAIAKRDEEEIKLLINHITTDHSGSDEQKVHRLFYLGNLYYEMAELNEEQPSLHQEGVSPDNMTKAMNYFRMAHDLAKASTFPIKYDIQTNLANILYRFGRWVEALSLWCCDFALPGDTPFVAYRNTYHALSYLSNFLEDKNHCFYYNMEAGKLLQQLTLNKNNSNYKFFEKWIETDHSKKLLSWYEDAVKNGDYCIEKHPYDPKYENEQEKCYRTWCLKHCLFLNPLNDINSSNPAIMRDVLQLPTFISQDDRPLLQSQISDIKREYMYARFLLFEGLHEINCPNYEITGARLTDLYDGNHYELSIQKIKSAFRLVFSILDKLIKLLKDYFFPKKQNKHNQFNGRCIKEEFPGVENPFIQSLYWIACDLYHLKNGQQRDAPNPEDDDIKQFRNSLEHGLVRISDDVSEYDVYQITPKQLKKNAMRVFEIVRNSILTATFAIHYNEKKDQQNSIERITPIFKT